MITITDSAKEYLLGELKGMSGICINVVKGGCSGLQYKFSYADCPPEGDEIVDFGSFKVFINKNAMLFIIGTQLDYIKTMTGAKLIFRNPNEKISCGCGKSFNV